MKNINIYEKSTHQVVYFIDALTHSPTTLHSYLGVQLYLCRYPVYPSILLFRTRRGFRPLPPLRRLIPDLSRREYLRVESHQQLLRVEVRVQVADRQQPLLALLLQNPVHFCREHLHLTHVYYQLYRQSHTTYD